MLTNSRLAGASSPFSVKFFIVHAIKKKKALGSSEKVVQQLKCSFACYLYDFSTPQSSMSNEVKKNHLQIRKLFCYEFIMIFCHITFSSYVITSLMLCHLAALLALLNYTE